VEHVQGTWWLPGQPTHSSPGTLTIDRYDRLRLAIDGELPVLDFDITTLDQTVVHGQGEDGQSFTLLDVYVTEHTRTFGQREGQSMQILVNKVLRGTLVESEHDVSLTSVELHTQGLGPWASKASAGRTGEIVGHLADGTLSIHQSAPTGAATHHPTITDDVAFSFRPHAPMCMTDMDDRLIAPLRYYTALATGHRCPSFTTYLKLDTEESNDARAVELIYPIEPQPQVRLNPQDMLLPLHSAELDSVELIRRWFALYQQQRQALHLFFADVFQPHPYVETRFLLLTQAAEIYHRIANPPSAAAKSEAKKLRDRVVDAAPTQERDRIRNLLSNLHEPSLRDRLEQLTRRAHELIPGLDVTIAGSAATARNFLTHYDKKSHSQGPPEPGELIRLTAQLRAVLTACLLQDLGVPDTYTTAALARSRLIRCFM
jgi:hypothetical protein